MAFLGMNARNPILSGISITTCCIAQLSGILRNQRVLRVAMTGVGSTQEGQQHQQEEGSAPGGEGACLSKASPGLAGHQHS